MLKQFLTTLRLRMGVEAQVHEPIAHESASPAPKHYSIEDCVDPEAAMDMARIPEGVMRRAGAMQALKSFGAGALTSIEREDRPGVLINGRRVALGSSQRALPDLGQQTSLSSSNSQVFLMDDAGSSACDISYPTDC